MIKNFLVPVIAIGMAVSFSNIASANSPAIEASLKKQAEAACKSYSANEFTNAIASSRTLANQYVAPKVQIIKYDGKKRTLSTKTKAQYRYPIMIWDNFFALTDSEKKTGKPVFLKVETNQSQSNRIVVEFYPVTYESINEGYEGEPVKTGPSQKLLFVPKGQCWQLIEHTIYGKEDAK